jgi:hypothetical protein
MPKYLSTLPPQNLAARDMNEPCDEAPLIRRIVLVRLSTQNGLSAFYNRL